MYWREVAGTYLITPLGNVYFLQEGCQFAYLQRAVSDHICDRLTAYKFHRIAELPPSVVIEATLITSVRV
jgi:hypothetical protein